MIIALKVSGVGSLVELYSDSGCETVFKLTLFMYHSKFCHWVFLLPIHFYRWSC